jgi:hypothetical protein
MSETTTKELGIYIYHTRSCTSTHVLFGYDARVRDNVPNGYFDRRRNAFTFVSLPRKSIEPATVGTWLFESALAHGGNINITRETT